jgi:hypothetical protein
MELVPDWASVRNCQPFRWRGEDWPSGHEALLMVCEQVLELVSQLQGEEDEQSYLAALEARLCTILTRDLSPVSTAIDQEWTVLRQRVAWAQGGSTAPAPSFEEEQ